MIDNLRGELKEARDKQRLMAIIEREIGIIECLGLPKESHPGAAGIAHLTGYSRDEVRYGMFAFAGLHIRSAQAQSRRKRQCNTKQHK